MARASSPDSRSSLEEGADLSIQELAESAPPAPPQSDMLLGGRHRLIKGVGSGHFAWVWLAMDTLLQRQVAIKIWRQEDFPASERLEAGRRFWRGAVGMGAIQSEHIVGMTDGPHIADGYLFFAMDYVDGGDLERWIRRDELSVLDREMVVEQLLEALETAHSHSVVHRDIKPANILLTRQKAKVKVLLADFDIAYYEHLFHSRYSTRMPIGVARYMPPDIFGRGSDESVTSLMRRSGNDLYALCVVIFELFTNMDSKLPLNSTPEQVLRMLPLRRPGSGESFDHRLRFKVAHVCAGGLRLLESERFSSITQLRAQWDREYSSRFVVALSRTLTVIAALFAAAVSIDALFYGMGGTDTVALGMLTILGTALGTGYVVAPTIKRFRSAVEWLESLHAKHGWTRSVVPVLLALCALGVAYSTSFGARMNSSVMEEVAGGHCFVDHDGELSKEILTGSIAVRSAKKGMGIRCEHGTRVRVRRLSAFGWKPLVATNLDRKEMTDQLQKLKEENETLRGVYEKRLADLTARHDAALIEQEAQPQAVLSPHLGHCRLQRSPQTHSEEVDGITAQACFQQCDSNPYCLKPIWTPR